MATHKVLIVGNVSEDYHLGSILVRAAQSCMIDAVSVDTNFDYYAPSMSFLWGRAFFKVFGKRPIEWWQFNQNLIERIKEYGPDLVLVAGVCPLSLQVFTLCRSLRIKTTNYLTDYPWNSNHRTPAFLRNLREYDLVAVTKSLVVQELVDFGVREVKYLPFGYDPLIHHQPIKSDDSNTQFLSDVAFIGTGDTERIPYLDAVSQIDGITLKIYGGAWNKISLPHTSIQPAVFGNNLSLATHFAKLSLGIVRRRNKDQSTMRTFEIPACGGCGIYEDTEEHRQIFAGYPEYGFFSSPEDLAMKCAYLLTHPTKLNEMRSLGIEKVINDSNTYASRFRTILQWSLT